MFSLNAPVPGTVAGLAEELRPRLLAFDRLRERRTLVVKRVEDVTPSAFRGRFRTLDPTPAFEARVDGVDYFAEPAAGPGPVVYLRIDSPGMRDLHDRLVDAFGAVEGIEGPDYVPHVTLARGGSLADARDLAATAVEPVTWTVSRLLLWDPDYRERIGSIRLPTGSR